MKGNGKKGRGTGGKMPCSLIIRSYHLEDSQIPDSETQLEEEEILGLGNNTQVPETQSESGQVHSQIPQPHNRSRQPHSRSGQPHTQTGQPHIQFGQPHTQTGTPNTQSGQSSQTVAKRRLHPTGLWFDDSSIAKAITQCLQGYFRKGFHNYGIVDANTKEHWWNLFCKLFEWDDALDAQVRREYDSKAGYRLRDMFNQVTLKMGGRKPKWMSDEAHKEMMDARKNDPEFIKRSEQNKKNRRGGSLTNVIEASHYQGSISAAQHAKRMAKEKGGVLPNAGELYLKTHFKEVPGKGQVPASKKAKEIAETFQRKMDESSSQGVACDPNRVYFETVGGRNRGKVKGLGKSDHLYYDTPQGRHGASQMYTPSIVSQLHTQFEERVQAMQSQFQEEFQTQVNAEVEARVQAQVKAQVEQALATERANMEKRQQAWFEEIKKGMLQYGPIPFDSSSSFFSHPDTELDGDGASGAACV